MPKAYENCWRKLWCHPKGCSVMLDKKATHAKSFFFVFDCCFIQEMPPEIKSTCNTMPFESCEQHVGIGGESRGVCVIVVTVPTIPQLSEQLSDKLVDKLQLSESRANFQNNFQTVDNFQNNFQTVWRIDHDSCYGCRFLSF